MKKTLLIAMLLVFISASPSFAVTYYFKTAGVNNNWSNGANWCDQTNGAGTCGTAPTASIDAVIDSNSGTVVIDTTTCVSKTITATGFTGDITFTAGQTLGVSGDITFDNTHTLSGTGTLQPKAAGTITMDGLTFPGNVIIANTATYTLAGNLAITGTLTIANSAVTFSGAYDISCDTFSYYGNVTTVSFVSGQTLTIATAMYLSAVSSAGATFKGVTASSDTFLHFNGLASACRISGIIFTDVNAAHALDNWYGGTLTRTTGITNRTSADIGGGGGSAAW